jgi:chromosome segregation ATPase
LLREEITRDKGTISGLDRTLIATRCSLEEAKKFGEEAARALEAREREIAALQAELSKKERAEAELIIRVEELKASEGSARSELETTKAELEVKVNEADEAFDFGFEKCRMTVQEHHPDLDLSFLDSEAEEEETAAPAEPTIGSTP